MATVISGVTLSKPLAWSFYWLLLQRQLFSGKSLLRHRKCSLCARRKYKIAQLEMIAISWVLEPIRPLFYFLSFSHATRNGNLESFSVSSTNEKCGIKNHDNLHLYSFSCCLFLFICLWALQYDHSPRRPAISEAILGGPPFLKKSCHCSWTHIIK